MGFGTEEYGEQGRDRHGSPTFYKLLEEMAVTHDKKSHDYASNDNPSGNYHFAGKLALLFAHSEQDAGFMGRLGEKLYRLANLESSKKTPQNESIEDTERDLCVIIALWISDRRDRRLELNRKQVSTLVVEGRNIRKEIMGVMHLLTPYDLEYLYEMFKNRILQAHGIVPPTTEEGPNKNQDKKL